MASEGKRIDLILEEFNKPVQPPPPQQMMPPRRQQVIVAVTKKEELPNNYQELYQNFSEYNNRNNPQRLQEIQVKGLS